MLGGPLDSGSIPRERGRVDNLPCDQDGSETVLFSVSRSEALLLVDGLRSMEYWDYATELDLPRRNGQVFLPEDDGSWWGEVVRGAMRSMRSSRFDSCVSSPLGSSRRSGRSRSQGTSSLANLTAYTNRSVLVFDSSLAERLLTSADA